MKKQLFVALSLLLLLTGSLAQAVCHGRKCGKGRPGRTFKPTKSKMTLVCKGGKCKPKKNR